MEKLKLATSELFRFATQFILIKEIELYLNIYIYADRLRICRRNLLFKRRHA